MKPTQDEGNARLLVVSLITFYVIWLILFYNNLMNSYCNPRHLFWLRTTKFGTPFNLVVFVFLLFSLWAIMEIYLAHRLQYKGRWSSTAVNSISLLLSGIALMNLNAQWESFEVEWGERERGDITFASPRAPPPIEPYSWPEFMELKRCEPNFTPIQNDEEFCTLRKEFFERNDTREGPLGLTKC